MEREPTAIWNTSVMSNTLDFLLSAIRQDARRSANAAVQVNGYWTYIEPILNRYRCTSAIPDESIVRERYWAELSALQLLIALLDHSWFSGTGEVTSCFWKPRFEDELYAWYEPTPELQHTIATWIREQTRENDAFQIFSAIIEKTLVDEETRRVFGEFYTPLRIAQHLAHGLQVEFNSLENPPKIVDPACGAGSLLGAMEQSLIESAKSSDIPASQLLQRLNEAFYGFDIQPCAVLFTRLRLMLGVSSLTRTWNDIGQVPTVSNIHLLDPLVDPVPFWNLSGRFDYVIANPPFSKLSRQRVAFLDHYEEVIYGHPNLYQLFLWWGIRATKLGGKLAFLVPQSFRSGLYFHKFRKQVADKCDLQAITLFTSRIGVFDGVDSPLMTITLRKRSLEEKQTSNTPVTIRTGSNGNDLNNQQTLTVSAERVLRTHPRGPIWCVSDRLIDYKILDKVYDETTTLAELTERIAVQNGGFVWNRQKALLQGEQVDGAIPLLSASSVRPLDFQFPVADLVEKERQFARLTSHVGAYQRDKRLILVKRTTPKRQGRRIVATLVPEEFIHDYPVFFVENHLNTIEVTSEKHFPLLLGLVGWLNSRLLNFVFQLMNGTSHISVFELKLLPMPVPQLPDLVDEIDRIFATSEDQRHDLWRSLDRKIYEFYGLTSAERERIDTLIP